MADCPECGAELDLHDDLEVGEIIDCATCGAELEVVGDDPVAVETALADARGGIEADRETVESRRAALSAADAELRSEVAAYV